MPYSYKNCQVDIDNYLKWNLPVTAKILDVGCGAGAWSDILREKGYTNIDGLEVWEPYINEFGLREKYNNLYVQDIRDSICTDYDLVIFGDILEHLTAEDSRKVIDSLKLTCKMILIIVPYMLPQVVTEGNLHENHLQSDLTASVFKSRYCEVYCISERTNLGITQGAWVWVAT